jgi:hypothetical protein
MALTRRGTLVERMDAEARRSDRSVSSTCFEILCGLPVGTQIAAAVHALNRFLPLYERMRPSSTSPGRVLADLDAWVREHGRSSPLEHDPAPLAESAFAMSFDGLLLARAFYDDPYTLTSGCTYAVRMAIDARANVVWMADDPGVSEMFADDGPRRDIPNPFDNVAWTAVAAREWIIVTDWLRRADVLDAPDPIDPVQIGALLANWRAHEETIVVPNSGPPPADPRPIAWDAVDARVKARVASGDSSPLEQILAEEIEREQE